MRKDPPDPTGPGSGHGYTLGGGAGGAAGVAGGAQQQQQLSPEEVRARRLAALGGGGGTGGEAAASSSENAGASAAAAASGSGDNRHVRFGAVSADDGRLPSAAGGGGGGAQFFAPSGGGGDSDDDDDLQRALALSLMESNAGNTGSDSAADTLMDLGSIPDAEVVLASSAFDDNGSGSRRSVGNRPPTPSPADERKPAAAAATASSLMDHFGDAADIDWKRSGDTITCQVLQDGTIAMDDGRPIPMDEYYRDDGDQKMPAKKTAEEGKPKAKAPPVPAKVENVVVRISSIDKPSASASESYAESVHSLLWNDAVTTDGDKERWRGQGIDTTPSMWADIGGGEPDGDVIRVATGRCRRCCCRCRCVIPIGTRRHGADGIVVVVGLTAANVGPHAGRRVDALPPPSLLVAVGRYGIVPQEGVDRFCVGFGFRC